MKSETKKRIKWMSTLLFILYILALVYFLFFAEGFGRTGSTQRTYEYNLLPFREIKRFWNYRQRIGLFAVFLNLGGNVIGFIPFGFILPLIYKKTRNIFLITFMGFGLSFCVECIQLLCQVGHFDVDDMILNTIGALLGYLAFASCNAIYKKGRRRGNDQTI